LYSKDPGCVAGAVTRQGVVYLIYSTSTLGLALICSLRVLVVDMG
jgi:hypothetical protein